MTVPDGKTQPRATEALSWGGHVRATLALGLPLAGAQLAQMAINTTDVVMLGWYGTAELAASVLATQAFFVIYMFGGGFAHAVVPIASQAEGRDDHQQVRRSVRMGLWIAGLFGLLAMPVLWSIEPLLTWFKQDPALVKLAGEYMRIAQWGMFPALGALALRSFFSAVSRTQIILWSTIVGTVSNAFFNWVFIFGNLGSPELGVRGAAIASVGSALMIFLVLVFWIATRSYFARYELFVRFWRPDWAAFVEILKLGLPIGITIVAEVSLFFASSVMMGWLGTIALAAHGISLQLISLAFMIPLGLSSAATVRVGQAYGRANGPGLKLAAKSSLVVAAVIAFASALVLWLLARPLVGLFLDNSDPDAAVVLATAIPLLLVAAGFQFFDSMQVTGVGLLRGLKDTRRPLIIAVISYWGIGLPTAYLLGIRAGFDGPGIWSGLAIGLAVAAVALNFRFFRMMRELSFT